MSSLRQGGAWRKEWRYVGAFCEELFVVAARVKVGLIGQSFWAVVDRATGEMRESTKTRLPGMRGEVWTENGDELVTRIEAPGVSASLRIDAEEGTWAEAECPTPNGASVWTRKRVGPPIGVEVDLDGRRFRATAHGVEDESAGYHPNPTEWFWSAGVGRASDGRAVGWNLVSGVNDPPAGSERAIWVEGEPYEPGSVQFDRDLGWIRFDNGSELTFEAEAERRSRKNLGLVAYDYRQPFGTFAGTLDRIPLLSAVGVMEYHFARW